MNKPISRLFGLLRAGFSVMGIRSSEEANYLVLAEDGAIQIRLYQPMLIAKTEIEADYSQAGNIGFNRLAAYIFGGNVQKQEIAMTTPVFRESNGHIETVDEASENAQGVNNWIMSFVMPPSFDSTTLPQPSDPLVIIQSIPAKKVATLRYAGSLNQQRISEYSQILLAWLDEQHIKRLSKPRSAAYDPPWTIPSLRRNEIHIDIE
ncbi:MAG: heme-binding protein [Methylococcaceae bacterium]|nr:heme-binding protein [Methylococcaceae bacterium]